MSTAKSPVVDDKKKQIEPIVGGSAPREKEPILASLEEASLVAEIVKTSEAHDKEAIEAVRKDLPEAREALPKVDLKDLEDVGVRSIEKDAQSVVDRGPTLNLDLTEEEYREGLRMRAGGRVNEKGGVLGTPSLLALALWIKRVMEIAHKHAKHAIKFVFKKGT